MPLHPVIASLLVLAALHAVVISAKVGSKRWNWHPELPRKLIHIGTGLVCLAFPWLFQNPLPVQVLCGLTIAALIAVRTVPRLRDSVGTTLHDVPRRSVGDLAFPAAVGTVFTLAHDQPVHYVIPVLLLTIADAAGALAGLHYGKTRYSTTEGFKSVEGSLSFVFLAFLCVHLPLLLGTGTGRLECVLIALILALLTMMAEAISTHGNDNFTIPVGGFFLLEIFLDLPTEFLAWRLVVLVLLLSLVTAARRWSTLRGSALLAAVFLGYGCFALGDWRFVLPPAALFLSHLITTHRLGIASHLAHGVEAIGSLGISAFLWLLVKAAGLADPTIILLAFAGAFATHISIMHCSTATWSPIPAVRLKS